MKKAILLAGLLAMSGCATIVGDKTQLVGLKSTPDGATVSITDEKGESIFKGNTPTNVTLQKGDGSYFGGKTYSVEIAKPGYKSTKFTLDTNVNAWYILGNVAFGGIIGWLIVDPFTGAMYNISPEEVSSTLSEEKSTAQNDVDAKNLHVMLLEDVPSPLRHHMKRIN